MVGAASIGAGLMIGILFSRLIFLFLEKLVGISTNVGFTVPAGAVGLAILVFILFFTAAILGNMIRIARLKPIDLMRSTKAGEKEPKAKWLMAVLGILCLGIGYYISLSVTNPMQAVGTFFIAVLFVIAGTYLLFISGSVALLKLLKNNKRFYYKKNHFVTVSGLMYRMKQNAAGLASICILSTMVLVTLFSTVALYVGTADCIRTMYPTDVSISVSPKMLLDDEEHWSGAENIYASEEFESFINSFASECQVDITDRTKYYSYLVEGTFDGNQFLPIESMNSDMSMLFVLTEEDYKNCTGKEVDLKPGEAFMYSKKNHKFQNQEIIFGDNRLKLVGTLPEEEAMTSVQYWIDDFLTLVVSDLDDIRPIDAITHGNFSYDYNFNLTGEKEKIKKFCDGLDIKMAEAGFDDNRSVSDVFSERQVYMSLYGSLFFIGIFIGLLFMAATVMIIYYKQISEGYDDRERFVIS